MPDPTAAIIDTLDSGSTTNVFSKAITVPAGTTRLVAHAHFSISTARTVASADLDGTALSFYQGQSQGVHRLEVWDLGAPAAGAHTLTFHMSASATGLTVFIIAVSGSDTAAGALSGWAFSTSGAAISLPAATGKLPLFLAHGSGGSPNTITDTSTPALTLLAKVTPAVSTFVLAGAFAGVGADPVTASFTIANGGGTKITAGYLIAPAAAGQSPDSANSSCAVSPASGNVGDAFTVTVTAKDSTGAVIAGATVDLSSDSGGTFGATSGTTDASGVFTTTFTPSTAGTNTVSANITNNSVTITKTGSITVTAVTPTITIVSGDAQSAEINTAVASPISVLVADTLGNPLANEDVVFAVASGGGSITGPATITTGADGKATLGGWTLGAVAGANTLTATCAGATGSPITFTANGLAPVTDIVITTRQSKGSPLTNAELDANLTSLKAGAEAAQAAQFADISPEASAGAATGSYLRIKLGSTYYRVALLADS